MEYATVTVQLTTEDLAALSRFFQNENAKWTWATLKRLQIFNLVLLSAVLFAILFGVLPLKPPSIFYFVLFCIGGISAWYQLRSYPRPRPGPSWKRTNPSAFFRKVYHVLDEGLQQESDQGKSLTRWAAFDRVLESDMHFWLMHTKTLGEVFPKRYFSTPEAADNFLNQVRLQIGKHSTTPSAGA